MNYRVVEKFVSINGEGQRSGELAVFIRLASCNLTCSYCDTLWANQDDVVFTNMTKDEIVDYILETGVNNITLTGGEPLLDEHVKELIKAITEHANLFLEIETNGSVDIKPFIIKDRLNLSFTVDYKSPSSRMEHYMLMTNYDVLTIKDTIKFVVGTMNDLEKAHDVIKAHKLLSKCKIILSPIYGAIEMSEIVEYMKNHQLNDVKLQIQLHKIIWDPNLIGV